MIATGETRPAEPSIASLDVENPWPGLLPFKEADHAFFGGRQSETDELFRQTMRERLTVIFGLSGLGKTSLLRAGLFPRLRALGLFPVYILLDLSDESSDLVDQVKGSIARAAETAGIEAPAAMVGETLWEYFHRKGNDFWTVRNLPALPLLAFDQFEEVFTLGSANPARRTRVESFLHQLTDLAEGRIPEHLKNWLDEHPENARDYSFTAHRYKILLSIREDFIAELEALRERMPSLIFSRFRLMRMTGAAAHGAVAQAKTLIESEIAEQVVRFVAAGEDGLPLEQLQVEPALLSVVCRELNTKRLARKEPRITVDLLEGSREQVLSDFYERSLSGIPGDVRTFIEDHLITVSGYRDSVAMENATTVHGVSRELIEVLIRRRLLRQEERGGVQRLELTHDLLTGVVRASRNRRRNHEDAERKRIEATHAKELELHAMEEAREKEQRDRDLRDLRRTRITAAVLLLFSCGLIATLMWAIRSSSEANKAYAQAQKANEELLTATMREMANQSDALLKEKALRDAADAARKDESKQRAIAQDALKAIERSLMIRQAALSPVDTGYEERLDALFSELAPSKEITFVAEAHDQGYKDSAQREVYEFSISPRPGTLPTDADNVAFITYLANHPTFHRTLMMAGPDRKFRIAYIGWGCLDRIVALIEYRVPSKAPTIAEFNMCRLLGWRD